MIRFSADDRAIKALGGKAWAGEVLAVAAGQLADWGKAHAPVVTGRYARSFVWDVDEVAGVAVGTVANTAPHAHLVEWGSANNSAHAVLRKAVRAAGLTLKEAP